MANVIKNLWDKVTVYCENHEIPEEMTLLTNTEIGKLGEISGEGIEKAGKAINTTGAEITDKGFGGAGKFDLSSSKLFCI